MSSRFTRNVLFLDGTLNHSTPRTDGKRGTDLYGTLYGNVAELARICAEAISAGKTEVAFDLAGWLRTRKDGSGTFYGIQSNRLYEPEAQRAANG